MAISSAGEPARRFWSRAKPVTDIAPPKAEYISTKVLTLGELFAGDYSFRLTCFQRAYSWHINQIDRLLDDIRRVMAERPSKRRYCLGRLMLAKEPGESETELVDGHQRLMTLTVIFAVLRDLETDPKRRAWLHGFITGDKAHASANHRFLISAQAKPSFFVESFVQTMGATLIEPGMDAGEMSSTEKNVFENRERVREELADKKVTQEFRRAFAKFLADDCWVITVSVPDQNEAWALINTEQETRLNFSKADQAKAILLNEIPAQDRVACSRLWEGCEALLSAPDMHSLLLYIRTMKLRGRVKSQTPVESDIAASFRLESGGYAFMSRVFVPTAEHLSAIRRGSVGSDMAGREAIARSVNFMSLIDNQSWVPAALQWLSKKGENDPETVKFFHRLDRLVWMAKLGSINPEKFETRVFDLIAGIERSLLVDAMRGLQIEPELLATALDNLHSHSIAGKDMGKLVLRRISIMKGADSGPLERDKVTLEHVLPRSPPAKGLWRKHFACDDRVKEYFQRLGNVTFLTGRENQAAGTHDWLVKKPILASSALVLAKHASLEAEWTPETIDRRTNDMIAQLFATWDLVVR